MEIKNDVKSTFQVSVLDSGFTVLRVKNDSQDAVIEKYPVNQDLIQFHFCLRCNFKQTLSVTGIVVPTSYQNFRNKFKLC